MGPILISQCCGIQEVPQKTPLSSALRNSSSQLTLSSIVNNIFTNEHQKMCLPFSNNINSLNTAINVWSNCTIADDWSKILTWLSPLEPWLQHQDIRDRRVENVGEWLLQTEEYRSWHGGSGGGSESDNPVLFCYGDPGVGKTYIR